LPKFLIWGGSGVFAGVVGGFNMGRTLYVFLFSCISPKVTSMQNFIDIE